MSSIFPPVEQALTEPNGLLAQGGELSLEFLLDAYQNGIYPWFNEDDPILWWSPNPRMILLPDEFKLSRSLSKTLRNTAYQVKFDTSFEQVMRECAAPRAGAAGTWIQENIIEGYVQLYQAGFAHSVETWIDGELVGGLYGVAIGRMFYGESMFCRVSNASKIAFAHLVKQLTRWQFGMIDCQMSTSHLASLGAKEVDRAWFVAELRKLIVQQPVSEWKFDTDLWQ